MVAAEIAAKLARFEAAEAALLEGEHNRRHAEQEHQCGASAKVLEAQAIASDKMLEVQASSKDKMLEVLDDMVWRTTYPTTTTTTTSTADELVEDISRLEAEIDDTDDDGPIDDITPVPFFCKEDLNAMRACSRHHNAHSRALFAVAIGARHGKSIQYNDVYIPRTTISGGSPYEALARQGVFDF